MTLWMPNKKKPLYAPMLATFGGGSVRGFQGSAGGGDTTKQIVGYDQQHWDAGNPTNTSYHSYPTGTQAGDLAIIFFGFSGYTSGGGATNEVTVSTSGWTSTTQQWGASPYDTGYADSIFYKTLTSTDVSSDYRFSSNNSSVTVYGLWATVIVRNPHTTIYTKQSQHNRVNGLTTGLTYEETLGTLPASGSRVSAADDGLLIYTVTDRTGDSVYEDVTGTYGSYDLLDQATDSSGNVFVQPIYTSTQADQDSQPNDWARGKFTVSGNTYGACFNLVSV